MPKHEIKILEPRGLAGRSTRGRSAEPVAGKKVPPRGHVIVVLTKEKTPPVTLDVAFDIRGKDVMLDMQASFEIAGRTLPLNWRNLQEVNAYVMAGGIARRAPPRPGPGCQKAKDDLNALANLATDLNQKASIPFRVYAVLGETDDEAAPKVVIFQGGPIEETQAAGVKKSKGNKPQGRAAPDADE